MVNRDDLCAVSSELVTVGACEWGILTAFLYVVVVMSVIATLLEGAMVCIPEPRRRLSDAADDTTIGLLDPTHQDWSMLEFGRLTVPISINASPASALRTSASLPQLRERV